MLDQYLRLIGISYTDNYDSNKTVSLIWIYFIITSFLSNIIFLNMLVGIMSDTFSRISDQKTISGLQQQT